MYFILILYQINDMLYIDTSDTCYGSSLATVIACLVIACLFSYRKLYVGYLLDIACVA